MPQKCTGHSGSSARKGVWPLRVSSWAECIPPTWNLGSFMVGWRQSQERESCKLSPQKMMNRAKGENSPDRSWMAKGPPCLLRAVWKAVKDLSKIVFAFDRECPLAVGQMKSRGQGLVVGRLFRGDCQGTAQAGMEAAGAA